MILVKLNGFMLSSADFAGLKDATLTVRQEDGGTPAFSFGQNVKLYAGVAHAIINATIFNAPNPFLAFCIIEFYDDCCKDDNGQAILIFTGRITRGDIRWCENANEPCYYEVSFKDASKESDFLTCLKNTSIVQKNNATGAITSLGYNENRTALFLKYYEEPRPKGNLTAILILATFVSVLAIPLNAIITVLSAVFTFGQAIVPINAFSSQIFAAFISEKSHVAPYLSSYVHNVCKLCGLTLNSSLLSPNGALYQVARLDAPYQEGEKNNSDSKVIFETINFPNITGSELLDSLQNFNVRYRIVGSALVVERKDYFSNGIWLDLTNRPDDILSLCFEPNEEQPLAGRLYEYTTDQSDKVGAECAKDAAYLIDYNQPFNPLLTGVRRVTIPYSVCRPMYDGHNESVLYNYANSQFFGYISGLSVNDNRAIIQTGTFGVPKLVLIIPINGTEGVPFYGGQPFSQPALGLAPGAYQLSNQPPSTNPSYYLTAYDSLLYIDDTRFVAPKSQNVTLKMKYYCQDFTSFVSGNRIILPTNQFGISTVIVESIEFDFKGTLTIQGKI